MLFDFQLRQGLQQLLIESKDSVYGKRDGALTGLALVRKGSRSIFLMPSKDTPGKSGRPHLGRAFTDVQELKQVS